MTSERLILNLFNGAKTTSAWDESSPDFVDDWKPETRQIPCSLVQVTYGTHIKVYDKDGTMVHEMQWGLEADPDLILFDGIYYGDFEVIAA